nr:hypothetical protein Iba_chr08eCG12370 [Ipomoea batatas]
MVSAKSCIFKSLSVKGDGGHKRRRQQVVICEGRFDPQVMVVISDGGNMLMASPDHREFARGSGDL